MADGDEITEEITSEEQETPEAPVESEGSEEESYEAAPAEAPVASASPERSSSGEDLPDWIWIEPHDEGIFGTSPDERSEEEVTQDDAKVDARFVDEARSRVSFFAIFITVVAVIGGFAMIQADDAWSRDFQCFVDGTLDQCKTAEVERTKRRWKDEDSKATNLYGDMTLVYFPADAQVKVVQEVMERAGEDWRNREGLPKCLRPEGMAVTKPSVASEPTEKEIPNNTANLEEGQTIERLPLLDMPIFEAVKDEAGCVNKVTYYTYKLTITREGYHPREFTYRPDDWVRVGPGNRMIDWPGVDLEAKPETIKANFAKVMSNEFCLRKLKNLATLADSMADENFEMMLLRNGFKTKEDFMKAFEALTTTAEHSQWWQEQSELIAKQTCEEE